MFGIRKLKEQIRVLEKKLQNFNRYNGEQENHNITERVLKLETAFRRFVIESSGLIEGDTVRINNQKDISKRLARKGLLLNCNESYLYCGNQKNIATYKFADTEFHEVLATVVSHDGKIYHIPLACLMKHDEGQNTQQ